MNPASSLPAIFGAPAAFAWRAGLGPLHASGGPASGGGSLALHYRHFGPGSPDKKNLWASFAHRASLSFTQEFSGSFSPPPLNPIAFPPAEETVSRAEWEAYCAKIERALNTGTLNKLVPARAVFHALDPALLTKLREELPARLFAEPREGSYRFLLKQNDSYFFGASPELLFRREHGRIFVPAIAGTRAHGPGQETLEEASRSLLASAKDRQEQALVTEGIAHSLRSLGLHPVHPAEPVILTARNLVHLYTPIEAKDPGIAAEALIEALHPTPAVGGKPKAAALDFIGAHEPWPRGLFASPLLFEGPEGQICIVAIRSGLLNSEGLHLFSGAGFVQGSTAAGEWEETSRKFDSLRDLLKEGR
ncbi:MAG: hypothetical protein EOP11_08445 [Proteobacteria bacterium]|nr:MAG: hypothetical protein EOP11_08445 [Pseudomonadota bacterium]